MKILRGYIYSHVYVSLSRCMCIYLYMRPSMYRCAHLLIDGRIYKQMRQHPFYGFPVQEFGTPKLTFFLKSQMRYFWSKIVFFLSKMGCFWSNICFFGPKCVFFWQNAFFYENVENVSIPDSDRARFFTPLRVRDLNKNL